MSGLTVDPAVGLPSGRPVLGSVPDGVALPYRLDLGGRPNARLVLSLDGVTASDAVGPAAGTITVPGGHASLHLSDHVQVQLQALDAGTGAVVATATTNGRVSNGAQLPATLAVSGASSAPLAAGETRGLNLGDALAFQTVISSGADSIRLTDYDLTVDGVSILDDPKPATLGHEQWVSGKWTAPTTTGSHTLVLSGSVEGTSRAQSTTYTLSVQPGGTLTWETQPSDVEMADGVTLTGLVKSADTLAPVAGATVDIRWVADGATTWNPVGTATTDAAGRFTLHATPGVTGRYIASTAGVPGSVGATTSGTLAIGVRAHVLLSVDKQSISQGQTLTFTVSAPMAGATTMLQLWNGVCWCTVDWKAMPPQGKASFRYVPPVSGTYKFGALTSYADPYAPTASDDLTVTVR